MTASGHQLRRQSVGDAADGQCSAGGSTLPGQVSARDGPAGSARSPPSWGRLIGPVARPSTTRAAGSYIGSQTVRPGRSTVRSPTTRSSRGRRLLTLLPLFAVVIAAGAVVIANRTQAISPEGTPVTLQAALDAYRKHPGTFREDLGSPTGPVAPSKDVKGFVQPKPGVYEYVTSGSDSIQYEDESYDRPFPAMTYAAVHSGQGCVWELYFTPIEEHTDAHRQCSGPGEYLSLAHMQKVSFAGIEEDETHHCSPAMVQVGGKASRPGGVESTVCHAHGNAAKIVITYLGDETVTVGGVKRKTHHMKIDSYLAGTGLDGTAVAEAWFDVDNGLYLKLERRAEIKVQRDGKKGTYRINADYQLTSLDPQV